MHVAKSSSMPQPEPKTPRRSRAKPEANGMAAAHKNSQNAGKLQAEAQQMFCEQLPELLSAHIGKWVAYRGKELLGIGHGKSLLLRSCYQRGANPKEVLVRFIRPCADEAQTLDEH